MDDLISRQAAIDAVQKYKCEHGNAYYDCACDIERDLTELPSAQPEPLTLRVNHELTKEEYDKLMHDIKDAPIVLWPPAQPSADVVEVVRCKDCKHLFEDNGCPLRTWWTHTEDDFCSYAERRTV